MARSITLLWLLLIVLQSSGEAQVPGFFLKEDQRKVTIPFYSSNSLIIIPVSINGNPPVNFLIDTGVRTNILFSKTLGDELGLTYTRRLSLVGADGISNLMASVSPINELDLGPIIGNFQNLLVLEEDFLELESVIGVPVYGIIGYEFFKYNPIRIDYDDGKLDFFQTKAMKWRPPFYKKLSMSIEDSKPYIDAKVKQKSGKIIQPKLLIDTGANHGLLLNRETTDDIEMPPLFIESEIGQSLGGLLFGYIGRVEYLKLSKLKLENVLTSYPDETAFSYVIKDSGRQGSLGAEVLGRTKLIIDYPRERLFIKKADNFYSPFEFDMSGLAFKKVPGDQTRIFISNVREGSPGEMVGVLPFDEIVSINKIPIFIWELVEVTKLFRSEEGRVIELELRRYDAVDRKKWENIKLRVKLQKQI
jgi:predicted aspartyl protease